MANRLDDDQTSLLTGMHELLMRRGTESGEPVYSPSVSHGCFRSVDNYNRLTPPQVSAVIRQYQRDVREAQQLLTNRRSLAADSLSSSTVSSETTDEDRSIQVPPTPTRRKSGDPTRPPPNAHPSLSQPRQRLHTPTPALPVHRKLPPSAPHNTLTIPVRFDSPPPSPVPDTPPLSPAREGGRVKDLNIYIDLVGLESTPRGFAPSIHQDRAKGPQDRWYYVIKGRNVGVFNNWSSVADSVNHVRGGTQHKADNESLAYEGFLAALLEGKVMISFRLAT